MNEWSLDGSVPLKQTHLNKHVLFGHNNYSYYFQACVAHYDVWNVDEQTQLR